MKVDAASVNVPGGVIAAAKVLNEVTEESTKELFSEAAVSAQLGEHPHVVRALSLPLLPVLSLGVFGSWGYYMLCARFPALVA